MSEGLKRRNLKLFQRENIDGLTNLVKYFWHRKARLNKMSLGFTSEKCFK